MSSHHHPDAVKNPSICFNKQIPEIQSFRLANLLPILMGQEDCPSPVIFMCNIKNPPIIVGFDLFVIIDSISKGWSEWSDLIKKNLRAQVCK